jgi:hypothetical protein
VARRGGRATFYKLGNGNTRARPVVQRPQGKDGLGPGKVQKVRLGLGPGWRGSASLQVWRMKELVRAFKTGKPQPILSYLW